MKVATCRKVPFISFVVSPYRKVKINLSGCNFNCKGCFAIAKQEVGKAFSVQELVDFLIKSCQFIYGEMASDVQMTGGEPTTDSDYLTSLVKNLRKFNVRRIGISTNGHLLDKSLVKELKSLNVSYIKLDIKAYTDRIHRWYTGESNTHVLRAVEFLYKYGLNFYVRTIYIPNVISSDEIVKIARFLSDVDRTISYKIYQFAPEQLDKSISKAPTREEMLTAFYGAEQYLDNVEFYITETAYKPNAEFIEVRDDKLLEKFKKIDEISKSVIKTWNIKYFTMNQILNS